MFNNLESLIISINIKQVEGEALMMSNVDEVHMRFFKFINVIGCIQSDHSSIRITIGRFTLGSETEYVTQVEDVSGKFKRLRQHSPLWI